MIVGMNYNTDGTRYIAYLNYNSFDNIESMNEFIHTYIDPNYDEVYTIDLNPSEKDFINYIVLHGCRIA